MKYKRIKNIEQYTKYCNIFEELITSDSEKHVDELDLLELLIEDFDKNMIEKIGIKEDLSPVELLDSLMKDHQLSKAELARQIGVSRQLITEILNYKRNISKKMVKKLSDRFNILPSAFIRDYELPVVSNAI